MGQTVIQRGNGPAVSAATQAEMEAASSTTVYASPGRTAFHPGVVKGWINFNGTGTIATRVSHNVTSITDNSTGNWTVTWNTDFSSTDYVVIGTARNTSTDLVVIPITFNAGSTDVAAVALLTDALTDSHYMFVVVCGDQ